LTPTNNMIENGDFEGGAIGWRLAHQAMIDFNPSDAHSGTSCLKLVADAPWEGASQSSPIASSRTYVVKGWARSDSDGGHVTIVSFNAAGQQSGPLVDIALPATGSWAAFAMNYSPPRDTVRIDLWLQGATPGTFWFDDIVMVSR